jgi:hypothetical protein
VFEASTISLNLRDPLERHFDGRPTPLRTINDLLFAGTYIYGSKKTWLTA